MKTTISHLALGTSYLVPSVGCLATGAKHLNKGENVMSEDNAMTMLQALDAANQRILQLELKLHDTESFLNTARYGRDRAVETIEQLKDDISNFAQAIKQAADDRNYCDQYDDLVERAIDGYVSSHNDDYFKSHFLRYKDFIVTATTTIRALSESEAIELAQEEYGDMNWEAEESY